MADDIVIPILGQTPSGPEPEFRSAFTPSPLTGIASHGTRTPSIRHLYIHIPFCFHKCHYCDFYSIVDRRDRQGVFADRLIDELRAIAPWASGAPLRSVFVGGGTPTLMRTDLWSRVLGALNDAFDLSLIRAGLGEFTVECNPETAREDLFSVLVAGGVDRLSIGAQSFDPQLLRVLERWHDPASVPRAVELARASGIGRISMDLIFAIPGQDLPAWQRDLDAALALAPDHLSCYALTYEPSTPMATRCARGDFTPASEDLEADLYESTVDRLGKAGLARYEISNFARPGQQSLHNLAYWRQSPWLAAGPSASAHVAGHRWKIVPHLGAYLASAGIGPAIDHEPPDPRRALAERIMTGVRLAEGLDARDILDHAGQLDAGDRLQGQIDRHRELGNLVDASGRWVLSDRGFLIADGIAGDLMGSL